MCLTNYNGRATEINQNVFVFVCLTDLLLIAPINKYGHVGTLFYGNYFYTNIEMS